MRMLIISEYIAPMQTVAAIRWTKIAKYLHQRQGIQIVFLTTKKNFDNPASLAPMVKFDPLLQNDMPAAGKVWEVENGWGIIAFWQFCKLEEKVFQSLRKLKRKALGGWRKAGGKGRASGASLNVPAHSGQGTGRRLKQILFQLKFYFQDAAKNCIIQREMIRAIKNKKMDFDVVVSSFGPPWPHLVAKRIKKKCPGTVWIADFRDPYAKDTDTPFIFHRHKNFTKKHCASADAISRVNDEMPVYPSDGQRVVTIYNGYDPEEALPPLPPPSFGLTYTGRLYGSRSDLRPVFRAIRELMDEKKIFREDIVFHYAGSSGSTFRGQAAEFGLGNMVTDYGRIPRPEALGLQRKSAVLLQAAWNTKSERIEWTGKTYEYMMSRKPIVCTMTGDVPHSLPSRLMPKLGGVCYEESRSQGTYLPLKQYIADKYAQWKQTGDVAICRDEEYISQFEYTKIADQVWRLITEEIGGAT